MSNKRRAAFVHALVLLGEIRAEEESDVKRCLICGHTAKNATGECHHCGVYTCTGCQKLHLGDASQPCPGDGIDVPGGVQ